MATTRKSKATPRQLAAMKKARAAKAKQSKSKLGEVKTIGSKKYAGQLMGGEIFRVVEPNYLEFPSVDGQVAKGLYGAKKGGLHTNYYVCKCLTENLRGAIIPASCKIEIVGNIFDNDILK